MNWQCESEPEDQSRDGVDQANVELLGERTGEAPVVCWRGQSSLALRGA